MATDSDLYLVVSVAKQYLGLRAREVLKVIEVGAIARIPRLPQEVVGITPYRGRIITVVDLAVLIDHEPVVGESAARRIVLLDSGSRNVGLLVDGVEVISTMDMSEPRRGISEEDVVVEVGVCGERAVGLVDGKRLTQRIAGLRRPAEA